MQIESKVSREDKAKVLAWMQKYCYGYKAARIRANILPFVQMEDRCFRLIMSELIHESHCASDCIRGQWFIPLVTKDPEEIEAVLQSYRERKGKALNLLTDLNRQIDNLAARKEALTKQIVFEVIDSAGREKCLNFGGKGKRGVALYHHVQFWCVSCAWYFHSLGL